MLETAFYLNAPSYFAENKDDDPSNDVYFVDYARTDAKELKPVAVYDTRIYSPAGSYDLKKYFPDADARIVAYDTGHGKAYVPASVLDGMFVKSYVDSLQLRRFWSLKLAQRQLLTIQKTLMQQFQAQPMAQALCMSGAFLRLL